MTEEEFNQFAQQGYNRIPVVLETYADFDTPLSIYLKLANQPYSYLLESVKGGDRFGRFSYIGLPATTRIEARDDSVTVVTHEKSDTFVVQDTLAFVDSYLMQFKAAPCLAGKSRFTGGLVGYFAYDTVRYIERKLKGCAKPDTLNTPDILLLLSEELAVVDNLSGKLYLIVYVDPQQENAYRAGRNRLKTLLEKLRQPVTIPSEQAVDTGTAVSEFPETAFKTAVEQAKRYIFDGDIMQVVLAQRTSKPFKASPLALYRALRSLNPSPYMYYLRVAGVELVGSSPETLVRCEDGQISLRPIAGTRRRGKTPDEDQDLARALLADEKERAEHVMLVDLGRNDVGRVAARGSVKVDSLMQVERYSHVMHIVSQVTGQLEKGKSVYDVTRACFPAGTVSGAPKIRAMQIIEELEPTRRGPYAGAVGYFGFSGNMDMCINIRTVVIKGRQAYIQAGAGIVADSVPEHEYEETCNKARAMMKAIELAEQGLE